MAPFSFNELDSDTRRIIWKRALLQASAERIVLIDNQTIDNQTTYEDSPYNSLRVLPFRSLVSPIMAVNQESRSYALDFYDLVLPVFLLPKLPNNDLFRDIEEQHRILHDTEDPDAPWCADYEKGRVYSSLRHDIFLSGFRLTAIDISDPLNLAWYLSPSSPYYMRAIRDRVSLRVKHFTQSIYNEQHQHIQKALSVWVLAAWSDNPYCDLSDSRPLSSESGLFSMEQKHLYWETQVCPFATRYFYWPDVTWRDIDSLMLHLFERGPGEPLKPPYQLKELISIKLREGVTYKNKLRWLGMSEYLIDPSQEKEEEQHRPCRDQNSIDNGYAWKKMDLLVKEMADWINRANLRSP
ncbi:uncharacterized protein F4817DRAFT_365876 [Daldinia loculata]|uniref:uncharacterized protein n=1 Tax=Daldinia loculata TaxID=103429 RepID=UPI0020C4E035|nr:uncharacterized protein F4817DRAFT_365876 [Daldinia loculata]KAI1651571.1 hypothetical protein F4817DRAFT_365876 [Daldinia loculata]